MFDNFIFISGIVVSSILMSGCGGGGTVDKTDVSFDTGNKRASDDLSNTIPEKDFAAIANSIQENNPNLQIENFPEEISVGENIDFNNIVARDKDGNIIESGVKVSSNIEPEKPGKYVVIFEYEKDKVIEKTKKTIVVKKEKVDHKPILSLKGGLKVFMTEKQNFNDPGFTAFDKEDGDLSNNISVINNVQTDIPGTYVVSYQVSDSYGHTVKKERTVVVQKDEIPQININGKEKIVIIQKQNFTDPGFSAFDKEDGDLTDKVSVINNVVSDIPGTYTISYQVSDSFGHVVKKERTVVVQKDALPQITINGEKTINMVSGQKFNEPGFKAFDKEDGNLTQDVKITVESM